MKNTKSIKQKNQVIYLGLFFFDGCFLGWLWESIVFFFFSDGFSVTDIIMNFRGVLHGPWVPIYGVGCILLFLIREVTKKRLFPFFLCGILSCGILEYVTSFVLEILFHARWWDYSNRFLNLNGRIYAGSLLFFGVIGTLLLFVVEPVFYKGILKIPYKLQIFLFLILVLTFAADVLFSLYSPNTGIGVQVMGEML